MKLKKHHAAGISINIAFAVLVCTGMFVSCITNDLEKPEFSVDVDRPQIKTLELMLGEYQYIVEVADTVDIQLKGLSGRKDLPENGGMLFVYDSDRELYFWMKDTNLLLSIAFLLENGKIVSIQDMYPNSSYSVQSAVPVRYALELPMGAFEKAGVRVGDILDISP
ncbi:MAG: DUF192 domain-containing protein [Spirochaetes bacterium]|nr:DUF192 domain-containing protein [Spirochaetota bacterium]MBL7006722.1 DUF192 domain-containing protein [Spirochaetia bacterium]